mgnify:FL=1
METKAGGEKQSRRELVDTIEEQKEKISKYENRLRDMIRAYKGLTKEKEALENSLKILQKSKPKSGQEKSSEDPDDQASGESDQPENEEEDQIQTLTQSLSTLSAEKSRLESMFQDDKRKLRNELSDKDKLCETLKKELKNIKDKSKVELEETKSKLIIEKHNRDKETNDHALMLRELQKIVADERSAKDKLETELQISKDSLKALEIAGTYNSEYEKRVRDLESQLKLKLQIIEELNQKAEKTSPELVKLHEELAEMKRCHSLDLERAEQKAVQAEQRSSHLRVQQESRVANLESRLQELSETVGTYDRCRQADQNSLQKLRERIAQLDQENKNLQTVEINDDHGDNDTNLDVQSLIERILRLRTMLRDANRRSENPLDLDELLDVDRESEKKWKKSYYQLKEDFEKLQNSHRRTPSPFMNSPSKKSYFNQDEVEELIKFKAHVKELEQKIKYLTHQSHSNESLIQDMKSTENKLNCELSELKEKFRQDLESKDSEMRLKIVQLESEVQKQRNRCLNLIEEKDEELKVLKEKLKTSHNIDYMEDLTKVEQSKLDTLVLHYNEEMGKSSQELRELRSKKLELESALHELNLRSIAKEQRYQDEMETMEENMNRLKRMATKEGSNLEYLKNVTLTYMLSSDLSSKEHMLKAIGAVLLFTKIEIKQVKAYNASWWPSGGAKLK